MARTYIHEGSYDSIPTNSSPGFLFLKRILPATDALQPPFDLASHFIDSGGTLTINGGPPATVDQVGGMFEMRSKRLAKFYHILHKAWDIEGGRTASGGVKRTVLFESTSITVFSDDPDQTEAEVKEFSIIELNEVSDGELKAVSVRTFMDARPVENLMAKLQSV